MLTKDMMPAFEGSLPSCIVTASPDGMPNIANLTRVWYIDDRHVAIADQLLRKTRHNLQEQPFALLKVAHPTDLNHWDVEARFLRSEEAGPLFERIAQDLRMVSWVAGVPQMSELRSVLVLEVLSVRKCVEEALHLAPPAEAFGDMLHVLAGAMNWNRTTYWMTLEGEQAVKLQASRGIKGAGVDPSALEPMKRLALLVKEDRRILRLNNIRSQWRYMRSIRITEQVTDSSDEFRTEETQPTSYLAFPIYAFEAMIGVICCEAVGDMIEAGGPFQAEDGFLQLLSVKWGEALTGIQSIPPEEWQSYFAQALERARLEWAKESEPFYSALSARERQVALRVAQGCTNAEAAKLLFISIRTVTTHLERIYQKLNVTSRAALTRYVIENGLLSEEPEQNT